MATENHITVTYSCSEDWDAMKPSCNGRFCKACDREVFDFTNHSIAEIKMIKAEKGILCGMFRTEQVEPDLVPVEFTALQKARYFTFAAATLLGLELTQAGAQVKEPVKIESAADTSREMECRMEEEESVAVVAAEKPLYKKRSRTLFRVGNHIVYRSKRFPFIRIRSLYVRGRFF
jgi:hypothetical protein